MPIYEEKLISPLAIRFTQEHIRTTFRDGRIVEDTVAEVKIRPGDGVYDFLLDAPFPAIEIIRWRPSGEKLGCDGRQCGEHWFTLDNRRLYCLQRVAAAFWPKRVAAVVEVLYADPGAVRKKYDSATQGCSVSIVRSTRDRPIATWDWQQKLLLHPQLLESPEARLGFERVLADDGKGTVDDLLDAPEKPCALMSTLCCSAKRADVDACAAEGDMHEFACHKPNGVIGTSRCRTPSTGAGSDDSGAGSDSVTPRRVRHAVDVGEEATAPSVQLASDSYDAVVTSAIAEIERQLRQPGNKGRLSIPEWRDRYQSRLGSLREFLQWWPNKLAVIPHGDHSYHVELVGDVAGTAVVPVLQTVGLPGGQVDPSCAHDIFASNAVAEIQEQLNTPGNTGYVRIDGWEQRYGKYLGKFRDFLECRHEFIVVPTRGRGYRVKVAKPSRTGRCRANLDDAIVMGNNIHAGDARSGKRAVSDATLSVLNQRRRTPRTESHKRWVRVGASGA